MEPIDLFYSYAHEDTPLRDELAGHLKIMERRGVLRAWVDKDIVPGEAWDPAIQKALADADLVLLLVSKDFLDSDYIWDHELKVALERNARGETTVIPVLVRACVIDDAPFAALQGLPTGLVAVTSWPNRDEAWTDVAKGIRRAIKEIQQRMDAASVPAPAAAEAPAPAPPAMSHQVTRAAAAISADEEFNRGETVKASIPLDDATFGGNRSGSGSDRSAAAMTRSAPTMPNAAAHAVVADDSDPLLQRVLDGTMTCMDAAAKARGASMDSASARRNALALIDIPEQKRILWVDDRPSGNAGEIAALASLQIEVVTVTSTQAALERLASDDEPFDLVLSDWSRPEDDGVLLKAGLGLMQALREHGVEVPVILYHGTFGSTKRSLLHAAAMASGAIGEACQPEELFALIAQVFAP